MTEKRNLSTLELGKTRQRLQKTLREGQRIDLSGDQIGDELQISLLLTSDDESIHYLQEVGCNHTSIGISPNQAEALLLQASEHYFRGFLDDGELNRLSLEWREEVFEGRSLRARGTLTRPALDRLADEWLAMDD